MTSSSVPLAAEPARRRQDEPDAPGPAVVALGAFVERVAASLQDAVAASGRWHVAGARGSGTPLLAVTLAQRLDVLVVYVAADSDGAEAAARDLRYLVNDPSVGWPRATPEARRVRLLLPSESSPYDQVHPIAVRPWRV